MGDWELADCTDFDAVEASSHLEPDDYDLQGTRLGTYVLYRWAKRAQSLCGVEGKSPGSLEGKSPGSLEGKSPGSLEGKTSDDLKRCKPLVLFEAADVERVVGFIRSEPLWDFENYRIRHERDVHLRCNHFPWTCEECPHRHSTDGVGSCSCRGRCLCDGTYSPRCYVDFGDERLMEHVDNCYDDCCSIATTPHRFVIDFSIVPDAPSLLAS